MNKNNPFNSSHASNYDSQWKKLAPMTEGLHFLMRILLKDLPSEANVLCVGAGTGAEIMALAHAFPNWKFTAVEPAGAMLSECRRKIEDAGFSSRCYFHEGYLNSLPDLGSFDAATSILVSQFMTDKEDRVNFFKEIYNRLAPGAYLVSADLATPETDELYENLKEAWAKALMFADFSEERAKHATSSWKENVAVSEPGEIELILFLAGFELPTLFYQTLFIHAWYSRMPVA